VSGSGNFPVVISRVTTGVERVCVERTLHQAVKSSRRSRRSSREGAGLSEIAGDEVAFPLAPFRPSVFEPDPDSWFSEVCPHGHFFANAHVRIPVSGEESFQLLQLLRGEVGPLSPLPLGNDRVLVGLAVVLQVGQSRGGCSRSASASGRRRTGSSTSLKVIRVDLTVGVVLIVVRAQITPILVIVESKKEEQIDLTQKVKLKMKALT